jgi:hypothetical protein
VISSIAIGAAAPSAATSLTFDAYGKSTVAGDLVIVLTYKSQSLTLTVASATGDITISG